MSEEINADKLHTALEELKFINSLIDKISRVKETNHIMSIIINDLIRLNDADQGIISLISSDDASNLSTVIRKRLSDSDQIPFQVSNQIFGWVLKNKMAIKIDDSDNDNRFPGLFSEDGRFKFIVSSPMIVRGDVIGLITLVRNHQAIPFTDDNARLIGIIGSQSAQILSNALLLEELAKNNELLKISQRQLKAENIELKNKINRDFTFENIIGKSESIKKVLTLASKASKNDSPVLIIGPTGSGKELIAQAIHYNSQRKNKPFVIKNCGVKTESLLESELFGHTKGSFTGANRDNPGLFKESDGGTIFLDEIGDAPTTTQAAILRVLESGEIRPIGASKTFYVDVRLISATNQDLNKLIERNEFRKDLFYRLNTITIELPPLKHRRDDIPILIEYFLSRQRIKYDNSNLGISEEAKEALIEYDWPGNVRQLSHEIERAVLVCEDNNIIELSDLSPAIIESKSEDISNIASKGKLKEMVEQVEKDTIYRTLVENKWNILKTSRELGLTRKGLKDKIVRYKIKTDEN